MPSSYADMNNEQLRLNAQEGDVEAAFLLGKRLLAVRGGAMEGVEGSRKKTPSSGVRNLGQHLSLWRGRRAAG